MPSAKVLSAEACGLTKDAKQSEETSNVGQVRTKYLQTVGKFNAANTLLSSKSTPFVTQIP